MTGVKEPERSPPLPPEADSESVAPLDPAAPLEPKPVGPRAAPGGQQALAARLAALPGLRRRPGRLRPLAAIAIAAATLVVSLVVVPRLVPKPPPAMQLTVRTVPATMALVHPAAEPWRSEELGVNPSDVTIHPGDKLELINADLGIRYRQTVPFQTAPGTLVIDRYFDEGTVTVTTRPKLDPQKCPIGLYRGAQQLGFLDRPIRLYEGDQVLELRGQCLRGPVTVPVKVRPNGAGTVTLDVSKVLGE